MRVAVYGAALLLGIALTWGMLEAGERLHRTQGTLSHIRSLQREIQEQQLARKAAEDIIKTLQAENLRLRNELVAVANRRDDAVSVAAAYVKRYGPLRR